MLGARLIEKVEPTAVIGPNVAVGKNNYIGHHVIIEGHVTIGDNNYIAHHCVIGTPAQNAVHRYEIDDTNDCGDLVVIGSNNVLREFSTVHRPMVSETRIGNHCYLMAYSHVSHDTRLADGVILANNCQIGGHTHIQSYANVGLSSTVHQHSTIGAFAMVGMSTVVSRDVPPFVIVMGNPIDWNGRINSTGLERNGFSDAHIESLARLYARDLSDAGELRDLPEPLLVSLEAFRQQMHRKPLPINPVLDGFFTSARS
jgi:UDP-N-acetylglucosamine acyltransferase